MKKRFLSVVLGVACASCLAIGVSLKTEVEAEDLVYGNEYVTDLSQYMSSTDFLTEKGVYFDADKETVFSRKVGDLLNSECGISFSTKFTGSDWKQRGEKDFRITLGENELRCTLDGQNLRIDVYNYYRTQAELGQYVKAVRFSGFDCTKTHVWKLARVYTTATDDSAYALRLYIDGVLVMEVEDGGAVIGAGANDEIAILNYTGVGVTVRSAFSEVISFADEENVFDLLDFTGSKKLFSRKGEEVENGGAVVDRAEIPALKGKASGLKWKMRSDSDWMSSENVLEMKLSGAEISFGYDATEQSIFADIYTYQTENGETKAFGGRVDIVENYDVTAWHLWQVVCVTAENGNGFALRFYVDDTLCQEVYTIGEIDEEFSGVRLINRTGMVVACKSGYYTCPLAEDEACLGISEYNTAAELLEVDGKVIARGEKAVEVSTEDVYAKTAGVEFAFKANAEWNGKALNVVFGASVVEFIAGENGLKVDVYNTANTYGVWGGNAATLEEFDETAWHTLKITRRKFERPNGANKENGFILSVYIDGVKIVEKYEVKSPMWNENNKILSIENTSNVAVAFKKN